MRTWSPVIALMALIVTGCGEDAVTEPPVEVRSDTSRASVSPEVQGVVAVATERFLITPTALDFGQVRVGESAAEQVVGVTNLGPGPVTMSGTGGAAGVFGGVQNCQGRELAEGESCQMFYRFTPTGAGEVTGTTGGTWNDQTFSFTFHGEGLDPARFSITPTALDFGEVHVGETSAEQTVTVTNLGPGPVTMSGTGGAAGVFGGVQNCQGRELAEGESCQMFYRFTPTEVGPVTGTTGGTWNGQSFSFTFHGEGLDPARFSITPTALDFGEVHVGETSAEQTVTVTNLGPGPVTMSGTGGAAGVFGGVQNCQGRELAEGESCQMFYRFTPTEVGAVTGTTGGTWNGQPFSFTFHGEGVGRDRFLISPVGLDFGEVPLGQASAEQTVTVTNLGPGPVTMSGTGGAAGVFGGVQNCQGRELAEGESCQMSYRFTPTAAGAVTGATGGTWNDQSFSFEFHGEGVERDRFLITPVGFDFGEILLGTTSPEQTVAVTNLGPGPVTMSGTGGAAGVFGGVQNCQGRELAEGESCQVFYRFTPQAGGEVTGATGGTWNDQPFQFGFRGVGVGLGFEGFLPPLTQDQEVRAGATLPVKARLADGAGSPIPDDLAERLVAECAVTVAFSGDPGTLLCASYEPEDQQFRAQLRVDRALESGRYEVTLEVHLAGTLVTSGSVEVVVIGRPGGP